jgi:Cysteine-rich secretory protein family
MEWGSSTRLTRAESENAAETPPAPVSATLRAIMRAPLLRLAGLAGLLLALAGAPGVARADTPSWLTEINQYRAATGLAPVTDNPGWDIGIEHHLAYLENTPAQYRTGNYASAHTEDPASPYYSTDGAAEAGYSDLALGGATTPMRAVDTWLAAPFHAIGMLRAQLTQVALAVDPAKGYAGLDVIQGIDPAQPAATTPVLFPGPGITTGLTTFGGESPDPRESCGWQNLSPAPWPVRPRP